jgi:hypothetical protein
MKDAYDKIADGLEDALGIVEHLMPIDPEVGNAMAQATAWAWGMDAYKAFIAGSAVGASEADRDIRCTCIADGLHLLRYLRSIGFDVVKLETPHA